MSAVRARPELSSVSLRGVQSSQRRSTSPLEGSVRHLTDEGCDLSYLVKLEITDR